MYDAAIVHQVQPARKTLKHFAKNIGAKSCEMANVYDLRTLKDITIKGICAFIRHSLRHCWAQNPQADVTEIEFQAESFPFF